MKNLRIVAAIALCAATASCARIAPAGAVQDASTQRVQVVFTGGHETVPVDRGRPVILIASALGVPPEVFREAFSNVHPAPAGQHPNLEDVRRNKDVLLRALRPYGVTNERLDEVSNYYRYRRENGELWPTEDAVANAIIKNGKVTGFEIVRGGSGYSSPPSISIPNIKGNGAIAQLSFSQTFEKNGAISAITLAPTKTQ